MQAIQVNNPGKNSDLFIDEYPDPVPMDHEVLVKVRATALNRADLLQRMGKYTSPEGASPILGLEMSGVVEDTGSNVKRWEKGDKVFGLIPGGGYAEYVTIHERMAMPLPENLSFEEGAAIPETFLTAYQALLWLGNMDYNERVLIHAGASGVGTSAIQIACKYNAEIAVTAGEDHKLKSCRKLGARLAVNYKTENFAEKIKETYGPDSIDLIIDVVGKPYWNQNIDCIAKDGRLIYLGLLGGRTVEQVDLATILRKRLTIRGTTLRNREQTYKIKLTDALFRFAMEYFERGSMKPVIDAIFDWQEVEKAHERMQNNKNVGKIVLTGM